MRRAVVGTLLALTLLAGAVGPARAQGPDCAAPASSACWFTFSPASSGLDLHYYASIAPPARPDEGGASGPTHALVAIHGHPRDANRTFDAALQAVQSAQALGDTLVVAPLFQVATAKARRCSTAGVPGAAANDLLWTCGSWLDGSPARNADITSFGVLDALLNEIVRRWPSLRSITVAGFSAGGQMVQRYIGFAAAAKIGAASVRYVVADPGTWLYFDAERSAASGPVCDEANRWKYGTEGLPATLGRDAAAARARYAAADVAYLEGELDRGDGPGTAYRVLDRSCAAMVQGPDRLQRGLAYAAYDRARLAPDRDRRVTIVPGCAHDVRCVFTSPAARAALLGPGRP